MAERKQKVSIPLTVLSVLIAVIVVFPIVWIPSLAGLLRADNPFPEIT